jgi:hypothetical protein
MKNSKHFGEATVFIYPGKDKYIGVCLELDLVDEDKDKDVLAERMKQRLESYVSYIHEKGFDDKLLNRPAPKKYWNKFYQFLELMREEEKKRMNAKPMSRPMAPSRAKDFSVSRENLALELA